MRILSKDYRTWSLDAWTECVRATGAKTLSQWAELSRSSYNHAVTLGVQRDVARALGWLPRLESGELEHMTDAQAAARFRTLDVASMTDMWRRAQPWCEKLRRAGRLESVAALLGISYVNEFHPSDDVNYYLERCARVGDFKAWCRLDRVAAQMARQHGLMPEVRRRAPKRPAEGYLTSGGYCASLAELAVARLLEVNGVEFRTQVDYTFTFPRGMRRNCRCDIWLPRAGAYVEVWLVEEGDTSAMWAEYGVRRRFKVSACAALNLRLLQVEGQLLFRQSIAAFLRHAAAVLTAGGVAVSVIPDERTALSLEQPQEIAREHGGDRLQVIRTE